MKEIKRLFMETIAHFCGDETNYDIDQPLTLINNYGSDIVMITAVCYEDEGIIIAQTNDNVEAVYLFNFESMICIMEHDKRFTNPDEPHLASNVLTDILGPLLNDDKMFVWVNRPIRIDTTITPKDIKEFRMILEEPDDE